MLYRITHTTHYTYSASVHLQPHVIRLQPRCDGHQSLKSFTLEIDPAPAGRSPGIDLEGNTVTQIWFSSQAMDQLWIKTTAEVETHCSNPFNYLLEPWAVQLPIDYPMAIAQPLSPYLKGQFTQGIDPLAVELAQTVYQATEGNVVGFLAELNQQIYHTCDYTPRETGAALPAGITWRERSGSCRDFAVLFIEACRAVGLGARFVSGYQEGDPDADNRELHAWAEVYLPGAGWRGFDPTHGLAVSDRHIPVAAAARAQDASPVSGHLHPGSGAQSTLDTHITIDILNSPSELSGMP